MSAFDDWLKRRWQDDGQPVNIHIIDEAFQAGRAYQREVDAKLVEADNPLLNYAICRTIVKILAKAIREQKIDD